MARDFPSLLVLCICSPRSLFCSRAPVLLRLHATFPSFFPSLFTFFVTREPACMCACTLEKVEALAYAFHNPRALIVPLRRSSPRYRYPRTPLDPNAKTNERTTDRTSERTNERTKITQFSRLPVASTRYAVLTPSFLRVFSSECIVPVCDSIDASRTTFV